MRKSIQLFMLILTLSMLAACGGNSGSGNNDRERTNDALQPANRIDWSAVPSEYNPSTEDINFQTYGFDKIEADAFGFDNDVEVVYSPDVPKNTGFIRIFKVWHKSASWSDLKPSSNGTTLDLKNYGTYQCSIKVENGRITALEGGCYVRLQIFLPSKAEIEVYNIKRLISKRFIPITTDDFLEQFKDATWADDKFVVIENYLTSYVGTTKKPSIASDQLGEVIGGFTMSEEKFKALRKLYVVVTDRKNLNSMIEKKFNYFDRDEARKIVGL